MADNWFDFRFAFEVSAIGFAAVVAVVALIGIACARRENSVAAAEEHHLISTPTR